MAWPRLRKLWGQTGLLASTLALGLVLLAIPGTARALSPTAAVPNVQASVASAANAGASIAKHVDAAVAAVRRPASTATATAHTASPQPQTIPSSTPTAAPRIRIAVHRPDPAAPASVSVRVIVPSVAPNHFGPGTRTRGVAARRSPPSGSEHRSTHRSRPAQQPSTRPIARSSSSSFPWSSAGRALDAIQTFPPTAIADSVAAVPTQPGAGRPPPSMRTARGVSERHERMPMPPRAGKIHVAAAVDGAPPGTAFVPPGGTEGASSGGVGAAGGATAVLLGVAALWLLRSLLPGLLTLDLFPWQSALRAMRLERPG
jgi:hypothetical protein